MLSVNLPIPRLLSAGEVFAGDGSIAVLRALPATRVAVIGSRSLLESKAGDKLRNAIKALDVRIITAPRGETSLPGLKPVIRELSDFNPDWIIAAGGGSVLDAAKIAWIFHEHPDIDRERLTRPFAIPSLRGRTNFVAVPTTAGTGSEVSSSAVLSFGPGEAKQPVVSHELLPDMVVLDPELTLDVPASVMAASGMDALAHALESYVSRFDNSMVDMFAEQAIATLMEDLPLVVKNPSDTEIRLRLMQAAMMAGWAQNLKVPGVGHALAHQFGAHGVAHGQATGALLAPAMRFNCADPTVREKYDRLAGRLGLEMAGGLIDAVENLRKTVGLDNPFRDLGPVDRSAMARAAMEDVCTRANPRDLDEEQFEALIADAIGADA
ncbi:MAG: iron-containing alcohol dehydrogenase [Erythrobacter sp.]|uniref:iron-containing alcohol dehydrogenase n=1 Tax=Erythrobacter sp. TaxID=1042 RepID=UPI003C716EC1